MKSHRCNRSGDWMAVLALSGAAVRRRLGRAGERRAARSAGTGHEGRAGHAAGISTRIAPSTRRTRSKVRELVDKNMLPHFDTAYAAQLVLGEALAHRDAGAAQALRRSVLSVAAAELRRGAARVHAGSLEDPAVPGQARRHGRDGAQRSPPRQRSARAGELFAAQDARRLEGLRRADRRRVVREVVPHRLRLGDPAEGPRSR